MAISHIIGQSYKSGAGTIASTTKTFTSNTEINMEDSITALATNFIINLAIDVSQIQSMAIKSTQPITIKTNSTSAPDNTLTLAANQMIIWAIGNPEACPLTVDVASLHVACPGATAAVLTIFVLCDLD